MIYGSHRNSRAFTALKVPVDQKNLEGIKTIVDAVLDESQTRKKDNRIEDED